MAPSTTEGAGECRSFKKRPHGRSAGPRIAPPGARLRLMPPRGPARTRPVETKPARDELRRQIARLERELGEIFATAFPRREFNWTVGAAGGPRLLGIGELELIRDRLADRLSEARRELAVRVDAEEANRALVERMIADPEDYRWVRVSNEDVGERGCKHWHSRPKLGFIGMLLGWWRVKLSSGCPLASGRRLAAPAPN